jgi:hypothetical protein
MQHLHKFEDVIDLLPKLRRFLLVVDHIGVVKKLEKFAARHCGHFYSIVNTDRTGSTVCCEILEDVVHVAKVLRKYWWLSAQSGRDKASYI